MSTYTKVNFRQTTSKNLTVLIINNIITIIILTRVLRVCYINLSRILTR